jgi:hypothetical protein
MDYRGARLGLPADGPGSVAGIGRRVLAISLDWLACILVSRLAFGQFAYGSPEAGTVILVVFFA